MAMHRDTSFYPISQLLSSAIECFDLQKLCALLDYPNIQLLELKIEEWLTRGEGDVDFLFYALAALEVPKDLVLSTLEETRKEKTLEREIFDDEETKALCESFRPFIFVETEKPVPEIIPLRILVANRNLFVDMDEFQQSLSEFEELALVSHLVALDYVRRGGQCGSLGAVKSYRYVRKTNESVRFDVAGNIVEKVQGRFRSNFQRTL